LNNYRIRSFIRRQGRITPGQQQAIDQLWPKYGLEPDQSHQFSQIFGRSAPLFLEIGFGNGETLVEMAAANPENDYLGIEVHRPGVGHLLLQLQQRELTNVRVYWHDAIDILEQQIADDSLAGIHLFFPDPWPKKRHHKRRIVRPDFITLVTRKLQQGGYFHAATDWENYAEHMIDVLAQQSILANESSGGAYCKRPDYRPITKFERRGVRLGHGVWDLIFRKPT
jgi:tRNA (guanine-N7-)-methyltransferase